MSEIPQIKTVIPISNAIFAHMTYDFVNITASQLDILFASNYGERSISPIVQRLVIDPLVITDTELTTISQLVLSVYGKKWDRLKGIYTIEYDKIHNYLDEYTESLTINGTEDTIGTNKVVVAGTDKDTTIATRTDNLAKGGTLTTVKSDTGNEADTTYGFNSTTPVNTDATQTTLGTNSTETRALTDTGTQTNDLVTDKIKSSTKDVDDTLKLTTYNKKDKTYKHSGNIGNLTTQELIKQDIKLWEWNFIESILNDVKELLTIPIYL